jgi:hypothetical protein
VRRGELIATIAGLVAVVFSGCYGIQAQERGRNDLQKLGTAGAPVAPVKASDFSGTSRAAIENSDPGSIGGIILQDSVALNDTVSTTVAARGIPDAVEITECSKPFYGNLVWKLEWCAFLFYRNPPRTLIIDYSQSRIPFAAAPRGVIKDLPMVPGYARTFGFGEPVRGSWPVTISGSDAVHFVVPNEPGPPPSSVDGSDYARVAREIASDLTVADRGPLRDRAQRAFARLTAIAAAPGISWNLFVYDADYEAGSGVPDGSVFISTKLIERLDDDELAAVLAHLMAHERYGHSRNAMRRANITAAALVLVGPILVLGGAAPGAGGAAVGGLLALTKGVTEPFTTYLQALHYLDNEELEADALAAQYLARVGIMPSAIVNAIWRSAQYPPQSGPVQFGELLTHAEPSEYGPTLWFGYLHRVQGEVLGRRGNLPAHVGFAKMIDAGLVPQPPPARSQMP